ncbi:cell wall metabolism sensor histidine kinase WalK [Bacillus sp. FJAT-42376]|uniref:cell wall metabolism sensor histidine kinase WalK n=1 Tax=Bacillus sp. FJAT-42376 TaxID=2014076 RepID=UPI000F4F2D66|nr:cell wall metabolism sensor histidine kinase WalK [Bacillus sp. FJAT-42376]AZB41102.1 cell wall metabolism sensor histidine kinase WalK [Bacillus sp. FJAT-42376]
MTKIGFFRSIHFKFALIFVLLIVLAMQIIGVYFVKQLEDSLKENFNNSINKQIELLSYSLGVEFAKKRPEDDPDTLQNDITSVLNDYATNEIQEVRVIDPNSFKVIATSNIGNRNNIVDKKVNNNLVKRSLIVGENDYRVVYDRETQNRVRISATQIKDDSGTILGILYMEASMEDIFSQMRNINSILATGTGIALIITALVGIFLARTITRPLSDMRKQALELAKGNFGRKVRIYSNDEIGQLALNFNHLTEELEEAHSQTEGERKKLASVIANMTDGVIATNRKGEIILVNDPAVQLLNVSRETAYSMTITSLLDIEEEVEFDQLIESQEPLLLDFSSDDKPLILRVNFSVLVKEHGGFIEGLIAIIYDVTEQEKIDEERREFVANVSHELRTPLTTMRSYLDALAEGAWEDKEIAPQFLQVTQTETERMIRLVNDLLNLSKMDSRDYRIKPDWINFTVFFNKIIDRFEMTKSQNVTFKREIPKEDLYVDIDTDKITQVLDNIISNALKYSPEGGKITFKIKVMEEELIISIKDEGVGIPKDSVKKIFDRFYRVDKARTRKLGGTGLGLAIAKEMVQAHSGDIWAESKERRGTTIYFTLPYNPNQEDDWE